MFTIGGHLYLLHPHAPHFTVDVSIASCVHLNFWPATETTSPAQPTVARLQIIASLFVIANLVAPKQQGLEGSLSQLNCASFAHDFRYRWPNSGGHQAGRDHTGCCATGGAHPQLARKPGPGRERPPIKRRP